ncbi:hypothetical protein ACWDR6_33040, partial [Streptomyces ardesiacus]
MTAPEGQDPEQAPPDPVRDPWRAAMRLALAEAGRAAEGGDVPVGAVVLAPGRAPGGGARGHGPHGRGGPRAPPPPAAPAGPPPPPRP